MKVQATGALPNDSWQSHDLHILLAFGKFPSCSPAFNLYLFCLVVSRLKYLLLSRSLDKNDQCQSGEWSKNLPKAA
jgi:hypothetical protein